MQNDFVQIETASQSFAQTESKKRSLIIFIVLAALFFASTAALAILFILKSIDYNEVKTDVDGQIAAAVSSAVEAQKEASAAQCAEDAKRPFLTFTGPVDYGSLTFEYPRNWSVFVAKNAAAGGDFEMYLNPVYVIPTNVTRDAKQNAINIVIKNAQLDSVKNSYESQVKSGKATHSTIQINGKNADRYDGAVSSSITDGSAVLIKIRDKTAIISLTSAAHRADFNALIQSVSYRE